MNQFIELLEHKFIPDPFKFTPSSVAGFRALQIQARAKLMRAARFVVSKEMAINYSGLLCCVALIVMILTAVN